MKEQRELLDSKKIIQAISLENRRHLRRFELFDSLDSTNTHLLRQLKTAVGTEKNGWVCLTEEQTAGRGRHAKPWFSPPKTNIYCSMSWCFPSSFQGLSALSIATALMVIQLLKSLGLEKDLGLKWPNDIVVSGRKLSGILLENLASTEQQTVVLGIGLNLILPEEQSKDWIGLEEILGKNVSRNLITGLLLDQLLSGLVLFEAQGLKPFLPLCRQHDLLLGKEVKLSTPSAQFEGWAQGINEQGELLVLDSEKKQQRFCYGEVSASFS